MDPQMFAALYVDRLGVYPTLTEHWYDVQRDSRTFDFSMPVVAHPPCQLWGSLAYVNYRRYKKDSLRPGNDGGHFAFALRAVEQCGGVLEHPAGSRAFGVYGLGRPTRGSWQRAREGYVTEMSQCAYGHRARKRTWLYYVGHRQPPPIQWSEPHSTHQIGWFDRKKPTLSKREASATPRPFAELLIDIAVMGGEDSWRHSSIVSKG